MDDEFAPFSPRRIVPAVPQVSAARSEAADDSPQDDVQGASTANAGDLDAREESDARPGSDDGGAPSTVAPDLPDATTREPASEERGPSVAPTLPCCDHSIEIRNEAVRFAAIACGRALRHALVLHPRVIATFVDDALRCAGYPQVCSIRVHPDSLVAVSATHRDVSADGRLAPGDIWIDLDGASVGADLIARAELLVAAAAET